MYAWAAFVPQCVEIVHGSKPAAEMSQRTLLGSTPGDDVHFRYRIHIACGSLVLAFFLCCYIGVLSSVCLLWVFMFSFKRSRWAKQVVSAPK